jgi:small-conductance mechanosensitive channel
MADDQKTVLVSTVSRRARKLRISGIIVMVLGVGSAVIVYWMGTRSANLNDDPSMLGYDRAETQQMGILYGKSGELIEDWSNDLKQPGTQAVIITAISVIIASGCFYFARLSDYDDVPRG